jgi:hypothetical protein
MNALHKHEKIYWHTGSRYSVSSKNGRINYSIIIIINWKITIRTILRQIRGSPELLPERILDY